MKAFNCIAGHSKHPQLLPLLKTALRQTVTFAGIRNGRIVDERNPNAVCNTIYNSKLTAMINNSYLSIKYNAGLLQRTGALFHGDASIN